MIVSENYFSTLGAEMALGRGFTQDEDETPGTHPVVVLGRFVQSFLYEVPAADPLTFAATAALLTLAGLVAAIVPTRRATRLDPMWTLQEKC